MNSEKVTKSELAGIAGHACFLRDAFQTDKEIYGKESHVTDIMLDAINDIIKTLRRAYREGIK